MIGYIMNVYPYIHRFRMAILPLAFLGLAIPSYAEDSKSRESLSAGLDEFKLVWERNIFNPNRRKPLSPSEIVQPQSAPRVEQFNLVGTMVTEASAYAFFDGSESAFRSVFSVGDRIAGYAIKEIRSDGITMNQNDSPIELLVGKGLERQDEGEWKAVDGSRLARSGSRRSSAQAPVSSQRNTASSTNASAPAVDQSGGDKPAGDGGGSSAQSDILKRLMEKRKQEMQK